MNPTLCCPSQFTLWRSILLCGSAMLLQQIPRVRADDLRAVVVRSEHFDENPGWDAVNNRITLKTVPMVRQDFGFSATNFAGKSSGEIGGRVTRCARPTYYADAIPVTTLDGR